MSGSTYSVGSDNSSLVAGSGNDSIFNSYSSVTIDAGAGDDTVYNIGDYVSIVSDTGDNFLINSGGDQVTISGGTGNDTILSYGDGNYGKNIVIDAGAGDDVVETSIVSNASLFGGGGNDTIANFSGSNFTLNGGAGNDILIGADGGVDVFQYSTGDGDDLIYNYSGEDILQIVSGSITSYSTNGNDVILSIGEGNVTLKNMTNRYATIMDSSGNTSLQHFTNGNPTPQEVVQNILATMKNSTLSTGLEVLDEAIRANTGFDGIQAAVNQFVTDCSLAGDADTFLRNYCGIILDNADTGAITGWDAGGASIKTAESIVPESGAVSSPSGSSFTVNGLTLNLPSGTLTDNQQTIVNGLYSWWIEESLDLINESYGLGFSSDSYYTTMDLNFYTSSTDTNLASVSVSSDGNSLVLSINESYYGDLTSLSEDPNGVSSGTSWYLDRTLAHEMTHGVQYANFGTIKNLLSASRAIVEGMAELTQGIDDNRRTQISLLAGDASSLATYAYMATSGIDSILSLSETYSAGYMFWRYLGQQVSNGNYVGSSSGSESIGSSETSYIAGSDNDTIYNSYNSVSIDAGAGSDFVFNSGDHVSILGGRDNDYINNSSGNSVTMNGGAGDDTLVGFTGGVDFFTYSEGDGNDLIQNFGSEDILSINSESIATSLSSGSDLVIIVGSENITVEGVGSESISVIGSVNAASVGLDGVISVPSTDYSLETAESDDTIYNAYSNVTIDSGSGNDSIYNAHGGSQTIILTGDGDDSIYNDAMNVTIEGGAGSDLIVNSGRATIDAGEGDDTIVGTNSRTEVFLYSTGDGNDLIQNFGSEDTFSLVSGSVDSSVYSGSTLILGIGSDSVTLQGTGAQAIAESATVSTVSSDEVDLGLILDSASVSGDLVVTSANYISIDQAGNVSISTVSSGSASAILSLGSSSASLIATTDSNYALEFFSGTVTDWNATLRGGNDEIYINDVESGNFNSGSGNDLFAISTLLSGDITLTGGADGNVFHAQAGTVSSSKSQNQITMTDINFDSGDVIFVDAGIENLTSDFFGDGIFYNYADAEQASTYGTLARNVFDASDLVNDLGMTFSMVRMVDASIVTGDQDYDYDEDDIVNVVWAHSKATTINFDEQTENVLIFTNTNGRHGDSVNLMGEFDDTLVVGAYDSVNAGDGNDVISVAAGVDGKKALVNSGDGNDTIYAGTHTHIVFDSEAEGNDLVLNWNAGDIIELDEIPTHTSIDGSGNLVLRSDNGTMTVNLENGSFDSSTNVSINLNGEDGILRAAGSDHSISYSHEVTLYDGGSQGTLVIDTNRSVEVDLSSDSYQNIVEIDAGSATGYMSLSGDSKNNIIRGGRHASTLWGAGGNDTLVGGAGSDTFRFTSSDGNVTITGGSSNDLVDMTSFTVDEIAGWEFTTSGVVIATTSNNSLTIDGTNLTTFSLSGGTYTADFSNQVFNS